MSQAIHSVLIVEDDPAFRAGFVQAVRCAADLSLAGVADDLPEGLRLLNATRPDVLLVDIGLPSGSGIELIRHASESLPACDVMVVTVFGDERHVMACLEAGASGYLLKGVQEPGIVEQIRALRAGGSPISPVIARQLLGRFKKSAVALLPDGMGEPPVLSAQEQSVLELSGKGYSYEEIARLMDLSRHTIETYVKRIYRKLHVHSKVEALYEARKFGLVRD
jgi:DNA-binding NarL/FixJ family response regulator